MGIGGRNGKGERKGMRGKRIRKRGKGIGRGGKGMARGADEREEVQSNWKMDILRRN
jgi:hypothetical protein